jgi:hypothetical protein
MTAVPHDIDPVFGDRDGKLAKLGFVPGLPIYTTHNTDQDDESAGGSTITVETLKRALFESSYSKPRVVPLLYRTPDNLLPPLPLPMVVELAQAIYEPMTLRVDDRPVGCWEYPDWYLRGYLHKSPFDATAETIRMHAYLNTEAGTSAINVYYVQLVPEPTTTCDDAPLLAGGQVLPAHE